eukprot:SAG22_NODE_5991_length_920_cov_1.058465_1_plen_112_part_10
MRSCKCGGNDGGGVRYGREHFCWKGGFLFAVPWWSRGMHCSPTDTGFHSGLYMLQTDVLSMANRTGGAATAAASRGSPTSSHLDGDMYMYSDLLQGSGGEKSGTPTFLGAWR